MGRHVDDKRGDDQVRFRPSSSGGLVHSVQPSAESIGARVLSYQIVDLVKVRSVVQLSIQSDAQFASDSLPRSTLTTLELS